MKVLNGFNVKTLQATSEYVKADKKEAERIRTENHQYFFIGLPVNMSKYEFPNNKKGMTDRQFRQWVEENRPQTRYMSFVLFKIVKFTPMGIAGGIFTSPKVVPTSLIVETMDGRQMEAYQLYTETYGRQVVRISDAVLKEVAKKGQEQPKTNAGKESMAEEPKAAPEAAQEAQEDTSEAPEVEEAQKAAPRTPQFYHLKAFRKGRRSQAQRRQDIDGRGRGQALR